MLENKCRTCGRDLDSGFNCPVCANKTMTTPTKEQISEIMSKIPTEYAYFFVWGKSAEITEVIITEWEKIRGK